MVLHYDYIITSFNCRQNYIWDTFKVIFLLQIWNALLFILFNIVTLLLGTIWVMPWQSKVKA